MPKTDVSQGELIDIINEYVEWNNLPLKWDDKGVCFGLSLLRAQYALEGKHEQFDKMINRILKLRSLGRSVINDLDPEDDLNHFLHQVIMAYNPNIFDKQYGQHQSYRFLSAGGEALKKSYQCSMSASLKDWEEILRVHIKMQEGEAFIVTNFNHAVQVEKRGNQYVIYDPNSSTGAVKVNNEAALVSYLSKSCFPSTSLFGLSRQADPIGLNFTSLSKESTKLESRTSATQIYARYGNPKRDVNSTYNSFGEEAPNYILACYMTDPKYLRQYIENIFPHIDGDQLLQMRRVALNVDVETFKIIHEFIQEKLPSEHQENDVKAMIKRSAKNGKKEVFDYLVNKHPDVYESILAHDSLGKSLLHDAIMGGQDGILKKVLNDIKTNPFLDDMEEIILEKTRFGDCIEQAIFSNSAQSVELLLNELQRANVTISNHQMINYLEAAALTNNIFIFDKLVDIIPKEMRQEVLSAMNMPASKALKTNIHILNTLDSNGVKLKESVQIILNLKRHRKLSTYEFMTIKLATYVDMLQEQANPYIPYNFISSSLPRFQKFSLSPSQMDSDIPYIFLNTNNLNNGKVNLPSELRKLDPIKLTFLLVKDTNGKDHMVLCKPEEVANLKIELRSKRCSVEAQGEIYLNSDGSIKAFSGIEDNGAKLYNILNAQGFFDKQGLDMSMVNLITNRNPVELGYIGTITKLEDGSYQTNAKDFLGFLVQKIKDDIQKNTSEILAKMPAFITSAEQLSESAMSLVADNEPGNAIERFVATIQRLQEQLDLSRTPEALENCLQDMEKAASSLQENDEIKHNAELREALSTSVERFKDIKQRFKSHFQENKPAQPDEKCDIQIH